MSDSSKHLAMLPLFLGAILCCLAANPAVAQAPATAEPEMEQEQQELLVLDLGHFQVEELRPTRNETVKVSFTAHVVLNPNLAPTDFQALQNCRHRLRDQIIVAVRTAQTNDFREPGLERLRRLIQIRVNQLLRQPVTESLLLSEYQFSLD